MLYGTVDAPAPLRLTPKRPSVAAAASDAIERAAAEHGIGKNLGSASLYKSPVELSPLRAIKAALDPAGIMNPGRTCR